MSDWKRVWKDATTAARAELEKRRADARGAFDEIAAAHKHSLASLIAAFSDGQIDRDTLDGELAEERRVLQIELLELPGMTRQTAKRAADAFFTVIG